MTALVEAGETCREWRRGKSAVGARAYGSAAVSARRIDRVVADPDEFEVGLARMHPRDLVERALDPGLQGREPICRRRRLVSPVRRQPLALLVEALEIVLEARL